MNSYKLLYIDLLLKMRADAVNIRSDVISIPV